MSKKKVLVIGAGPGGLSSAMILAEKGFEVEVYERSHSVGGRNAEIQLGDFSFDTGPTFLHQKFTLDEMFAEAGEKVEDHLELMKVDPMVSLNFSDRSIQTSSDPEKMKAEIQKHFPGNEEGFERFMKDHQKKLEKTFPCLEKPYQRIGDFLNLNLIKAAPYVFTKNSVYDELGKYFDDELLKLAFTFQAKYLGMSPWKCPALFTIVSYLEYKFGLYHVKGGLNKISQAMAQIIEAKGGTVWLNNPIQEILWKGKKAIGVKLESGEERIADDVIINADYGYARTHLFGKHNLSDQKMRKKKFSCSTFMLYLGIDTLYEEPFHQIIFADDYKADVENIVGEASVSDDMSVYVRNSSILDAEVAPAGQSGLYILVPTINTRNVTDWESFQDSYKEKVIDRIIARTGMKDLRDHIVEEKVFTPSTWEKEHVFMGATFNLAHSMNQLLCFRPHNQMAGFKNLYLTGGGTHPGSGLPTIFQSGRIAADLICKKHKVPYVWADYHKDIL